MTSPEKQPAQRLLERNQLEAVLAPYTALAPHLGWSVSRPDGPVVVRVGAAASAGDEGSAFPLTADGSRAGTLVMHGGAGESDLRLAIALQQMLNVLAAETFQRRALAAEALERYRELNLLFRVNETLSGTLDPDSIPQLLLAESGRVVPFDGALVLFPPDPPGAPWRIKARAGLEAPLAEPGAAVLDLVTRVTQGGHADISVAPFAAPLPAGAEHWQALLCAPLQSKSRTLGAVVLARGGSKPEFSASDEKLLAALAGHVAVALENTLLYQSALDAQRLEHELRLAYEVQASLMPHSVPEADGWQFAAWWQPAHEVSGDFYDFIPMEGALGIVVGDVTDKGMPSALFMANTRSIIRASTTLGRPAADSLNHANRLLSADSVGSMFVTLFYARLEFATRELVYVNGGHNPPLWYAPARAEPVALKRTGIMLGVDEDAQFSEARIRLDPGDVLVLYTDGLTEALSGSGERFTEKRLRQVLAAHRDAPAGEILAATQAVLRDFTGPAPLYDDITMVVLRCA